ncbi:cytochrome P450 52E2 [Astrocystis sublimbata]|nr:cytochrome P450 52E2 [Astrocystis sublimbata]
MQPQSRTDLHALPRAPQFRFFLGVLGLSGLCTLHFAPDLIAHLSSSQHLLSILPHPPLALLAFVALIVFGPLLGGYTSRRRAAALGCLPAPRYPARDLWGIRYMKETSRQLKANSMLQERKETLEETGGTFVHGAFDFLGGGGEVITTCDWEVVRAVLCTQFADWEMPSARIWGFLPVLGKHSIFTTNGPEWQHSRAILRPAFVRDQISDLACVDGHVRKLIAVIRAATSTSPTSPVDLQALFSNLTTDTISDFMFGASTDLLRGDAPADSYKFGRYFDKAMGKIAWRSRMGWFGTLVQGKSRDPELDEYAGFLRAFVRGYVLELREREKGQAAEGGRQKHVFLNELLKSGESDEGVCDHLLSIFTAGRDTTTSVLSYLFFELSRRPAIVQRLRQEIADLGLSSPSSDNTEHPAPTWDQLRSMRYLNHVLKEALRLNPPVAVNAREAVRDTVLPRGGGTDGKAPVFVRKGTLVRYVPWVMHRRKDVFGVDADEFRPERWEDLRVTLEYIPFNAGPRICIGQQFALTQMALITFRLVQAFKTIESPDNRPLTQVLGINTSMLHGCPVRVTPA